MTMFPFPASECPSGFEFSADTSRVDRAQVHRWLSGESYWAVGRSRSVQDAAINASWNFGIYRTGTDEQVAYARVVTDGVTFAWLCDVFTDSSVRGVGLGKVLVAEVCRHLEELDIKRIVLSTGDAHGLYEKYGFTKLPEPDRWMIRC